MSGTQARARRPARSHRQRSSVLRSGASQALGACHQCLPGGVLDEIPAPIRRTGFLRRPGQPEGSLFLSMSEQGPTAQRRAASVCFPVWSVESMRCSAVPTPCSQQMQVCSSDAPSFRKARSLSHSSCVKLLAPLHAPSFQADTLRAILPQSQPCSETPPHFVSLLACIVQPYQRLNPFPKSARWRRRHM